MGRLPERSDQFPRPASAAGPAFVQLILIEDGSDRAGTTNPWEVVIAFVITDGCVDIKDKTCLQNCPVDCIYEGDRMTYIQPDECIDCGACEPLCPQQAIFYAPDVPEKLLPFIAINAEFFTELGSPGDARGIDVTDRDHPAIAALPPKPAAAS